MVERGILHVPSDGGLELDIVKRNERGPGMVRNLFILVILVLAAPSQGQAEEESSHFLGLQGGWHSVELDYESPTGVFADFGVPYAVWIMERAVLPLHLRSGYGFHFDNSGWQIRLGLRLDLLTSLDGNLELVSGEDGTGKSLFWLMLPEVEFRYDFNCGISLGLVLPIVIFGGTNDGTDSLFCVPGLPALQLYFGYRWAL